MRGAAATIANQPLSGPHPVRGFDDSRISQTVDGIPLNDTGGYALYSSQMIDPELIEQINVNLVTTDVDSPTASATGSTVNLRTRKLNVINLFDKLYVGGFDGNGTVTGSFTAQISAPRTFIGSVSFGF